MSVTSIDDFGSPWQPDASGLWTATSNATAAHLGADRQGMAIEASAGTSDGPDPFVRRVFGDPLDLQAAAELRFWLRASKPADGSMAHPYYLAFEAGDDPAAGQLPWHRLLTIARPGTWELQRIHLGDMPADLRAATAVLRIRGLDRTIQFQLAVDDLVTCTLDAVRDVETALQGRLGAVLDEPVVLLPTATTPGVPYLGISPWAVVPQTEHLGEEVVDNQTADGAFVRPHPRIIRLDYRLEAFGDERAQQAALLEAVIAELAGDPRIVAGNDPLVLSPFEPSPTAAGPVQPGVTPLYYRVVTWHETGARVFRPRAVPFILTGQPGEATPEVSPV
jgi:hypothetical protein